MTSPSEPIYFQRTSAATRQPTKGFDTDTGWDLYTSQEAEIPGHSFQDVHTDISIAFPEGYWGLLLSRSSTVRLHKCRVETAVIDNEYRGELFIGVWNLQEETVHIPVGTRLAQLVLFELIQVTWREVMQLPTSKRGTDGFGSTGR